MDSSAKGTRTQGALCISIVAAGNSSARCHRRVCRRRSSRLRRGARNVDVGRRSHAHARRREGRRGRAPGLARRSTTHRLSVRPDLLYSSKVGRLAEGGVERVGLSAGALRGGVGRLGRGRAGGDRGGIRLAAPELAADEAADHIDVVCGSVVERACADQ